MSKLSHLDSAGRARMVDVGAKPVTSRRAVATATLTCAPATLAAVQAGEAPKGSLASIIATAELAGVMAAKRTADLIPLCHPLPLTSIAVNVAIDEQLPGFRVTAIICNDGKTGVEMESLTAVSITALTLFDMLKAIDKTMVIGAVQVTEKSGGQSGDWPGDPATPTLSP